MIHPALQSQGNAEGRTPVVLLTGADRLSLDSVAFSLVDSFPSVCSIAYVCFVKFLWAVSAFLLVRLSGCF